MNYYFFHASLWNQYKFIAFNIFSCKILIISIKILIITVISNETTNELTIYVKLYRNVAMFYRQETASLFQVQQKLRACGNCHCVIFTGIVTAGDSHVKIISSHAAVSNENAILCFPDNVHLLKCFPITVTQIKYECKFPNFRFF